MDTLLISLFFTFMICAAACIIYDILKLAAFGTTPDPLGEWSKGRCYTFPER